MKISAAKYYIIVNILFFTTFYILQGTTYLGEIIFLHIFAAPIVLFLRFYRSIFDLSHILKHRYRFIFEEHVWRWEITWSDSTKLVSPICIFSASVNGINDLDVKEIVSKAKINLLFHFISFVTLPLGYIIILALI